MKQPNIPEAVAKLDALIAAMSAGMYMSSYESQLLTMAQDVRTSLTPSAGATK